MDFYYFRCPYCGAKHIVSDVIKECEFCCAEISYTDFIDGVSDQFFPDMLKKKGELAQ